MAPQPNDQPQPKAPICPHCAKTLGNIGWLRTPTSDGLLITFYHDVPECMMALNSQLAPMQIQRPQLALPNDLRPRGLG